MYASPPSQTLDEDSGTYVMPPPHGEGGSQMSCSKLCKVTHSNEYYCIKSLKYITYFFLLSSFPDLDSHSDSRFRLTSRSISFSATTVHHPLLLSVPRTNIHSLKFTIKPTNNILYFNYCTFKNVFIARDNSSVCHDMTSMKVSMRPKLYERNLRSWTKKVTV